MLENKPKLVLSSEWSYSPFTYPFSPKELSDFIFIGIPASECQNPLIVPLAAHELGHVVWNRKGAQKYFDADIKQEVLNQYSLHINDFHNHFNTKVPKERLASDIFAIRFMTESYALAQRQIEETFCDFIALHVFGQAFLLSFRYLLAPSLGNTRHPHYPRIYDRATNLVRAARKFGFNADADFASSFSDQNLKMTIPDGFIQNMADLAAKSLVEKIVGLVDIFKGRTQRYIDLNDEECCTLKSMQGLVPPSNVNSFQSIVNAAWKIRLNLDDWNIPGGYKNKEEARQGKIRVLRDVTLKSFEVFEYQQRVKKNAT